MGHAGVDAAASAEAEWLEGFARGFGELACAHDVMLVGGDTTAGPLDGERPDHGTRAARHGVAPRRRTGGRCARGDRHDRRCGCRARARDGHAPTDDAAPRASCAGASSIRRRESSSAWRRAGSRARRWICPTDSRAICRSSPAASGLGAHVDVERLPLSRALRRPPPIRNRRANYALGGGDDYELLLAVPPARFAALAARAAALNLTLTTIGELRRGNSVQWTLESRIVRPCGPRIFPLSLSPRPKSQFGPNPAEVFFMPRFELRNSAPELP